MLKKGELIPDLKIDVKPLIVSCSGIIPVKRVHLIANAIKQLDFQLTWVHFGDGPLAESIKNIVNSMDKSKICYFPGFMPNANIQSFYAQNNVDIFISASESEGLPVSMMEAQAYGIPILAPELNGIPEIVNEYTGRLFSPNLTALELSKKIESFLKIESFDNQVIKNHFKEHFSAEDNYDKFAIELKESSFQN
jgi:glycosyltransferase involved in cell wall biosynthesis